MANDRKTQDLDELGLPKRKYEIEPKEESYAGQRAFIGLVLANSFLLLKNVLFGEDSGTATAASGGGKAKETGAAGASGGAEVAAAETDAAPEAPEGGDWDEEGPVGSGTTFGLYDVPYEFDPSGLLSAPRRPGTSAIGNDNESLYLAAPGGAIALTPEDGIALGNRARSGPAAPGDEAGPGAEPGDDDDGSDADEDDEDDEEDDETEPDDDDPDGPANRLPTIGSAVILASILANKSVVVAQAALLEGAADADGDALHVVGLQASSGSLVPLSSGAWLFTPEEDDVSDVTFTYSISDGYGAVAQSAFLDILPPEGKGILRGTPGKDLLIGTPDDDIIVALAGDDDIIAREGNDVIYGDEGNDRIVAGEGNDVVFAGDGDDVVFAGDGDDIVFAGAGHDIVFGEAGDDVLLGESGDDILVGGDGDDTIDGGDGDDRMFGDAGADTLVGADGNDEIEGGDGDDVISAGSGDDTIDGGAGHDTIYAEDGNDIISGGEGDDMVLAGAGDDVVEASAGDDHYDGGDGRDTLSFAGSAADTVIDLAAGTAESEETGKDTLVHFEVIIGGRGNDTIIASTVVETLSGGAGNDIFHFTSSSAAGRGPGARDRILDFEVGDRIDIDDISEEFEKVFDDTFVDHGIRKFVIISQHSVFSKPGEIRFKYDPDNNHTVIEGNIDRTAETEFEIEIFGNYVLTDNDFHWRA